MKETVTDKFSIERLIVPENKVGKGWYSENDGFLEESYINELKKIQTLLKPLGVDCTLKEAEYFWSAYSTDMHHATFLCVCDEFNEDIELFAKNYFEI